MKYLGLILLIIVCWVPTTVLGRSNLYTGWTQKFFDNTPYESQTAEVGDTITFIWTDDEVQNVFIHPTNNCSQTGRIPVGNVSPSTYIFTEDDASPKGKEIFFTCDIDDRCEEHGMRMSITVFSSSEDAGLEPTSTPGVVPTSPPVSLTAAPTDPIVVPTEQPVSTDAPVAPTENPIAPTLAPSSPIDSPFDLLGNPPTDPPTADPVDPPSNPPTDAPIVPVAVPIIPPTEAPVDSPSSPPTDAPVAPVAVPITPPTEAPIDPPTNPPTNAPVAPVAVPIIPPTEAPVNAPTNMPTEAPVISSPTTLPPIATSAPSAKPVEPVVGPTETPTTSQPVDGPTLVESTKTMRGLIMAVDGINSFSGNTEDAWKKTTENFCTSQYENDFSVFTFTTKISVTNSQEISQRRYLLRGQRGLQAPGSSFVITYNQVVSYDSSSDDIDEDYLAKSAFAFPEQRDDYVKLLQNSGDPALEAVTDTTPPVFANDNVPTMTPISPKTLVPVPSPKSPVLSMAAIIGIACGGGALLIIIILSFIYCNKKGSTDNPKIDSNPPPRNVSLKEDEVSTLAGPSIAGGGPPGDRSVGTVDYDYSKAYGNGDTSVSSAGGTFGSNTQNISLPANAGATGAALGPYDDDGSYQEHFNNSGNNVKEEILHIFAPPGKLGVVIDTPDDGAPIVHAVKDSSVVVDKVQVGDKLVAVDDEDVRTLTAIKVSKLISRKSANPSRKLTILRTTPIE